MKKIFMILESGEEIFCGFATSIFKYLLSTYEFRIVPMSGNREYVLIRNVYNHERNQIVSYKSVAHE